MLVPFDIFSLGLLPCVQLSGATRGLLGDCELDRRLYGLKESSIAGLLSATWVETAEPEKKRRHSVSYHSHQSAETRTGAEPHRPNVQSFAVELR